MPTAASCGATLPSGYVRVRVRAEGVGVQGGTLEKGSAVARGERAPPHAARQPPRRQFRPVDGSRKSRSQMDEREHEGTSGLGGSTKRYTSERTERPARERDRGEEEARSQKGCLSVSYVVTESGTLRESYRHWVAARGSGRTKAEPGALFRAQYARRARFVRPCAVVSAWSRYRQC